MATDVLGDMLVLLRQLPGLEGGAGSDKVEEMVGSSIPSTLPLLLSPLSFLVHRVGGVQQQQQSGGKWRLLNNLLPEANISVNHIEGPALPPCSKDWLHSHPFCRDGSFHC